MGTGGTGDGNASTLGATANTSVCTAGGGGGASLLRVGLVKVLMVGCVLISGCLGAGGVIGGGSGVLTSSIFNT